MEDSWTPKTITFSSAPWRNTYKWCPTLVHLANSSFKALPVIISYAKTSPASSDQFPVFLSYLILVNLFLIM